jgi:hypothetical protein
LEGLLANVSTYTHLFVFTLVIELSGANRSLNNKISSTPGIYGKDSALFFQYSKAIPILRNRNPDLLFFFENVASMDWESRYGDEREIIGYYMATLCTASLFSMKGLLTVL